MTLPDPDSEGKPVAHFNKSNITNVLCVNVFWEDSCYAEGMNIPGRQPLRSDDDSALALLYILLFLYLRKKKRKRRKILGVR